jgi:CheY-like chemotaxis protein
MKNSNNTLNISNFDLEIIVSDKTNLLLINKNLTQLYMLVQSFSKFGGHITAVSNKRDALFVLKRGEYDFIIIDKHVLDLNNKLIYQMIQKSSLAIPSLLIESENLVVPQRELDK